MTPNVREELQYGTAIGMVVSGIVLAFLSFFLNNYVISDSILWYIGQALVFFGAISGVNVYIKSKVNGELSSMLKQKKESK